MDTKDLQPGKKKIILQGFFFFRERKRPKNYLKKKKESAYVQIKRGCVCGMYIIRRTKKYNL